MDHRSVIVVGAGPIGLALHVVLKRMGVDCLHLEAGAIGQTVTWYPKQARFFSSPERIAIAGVPLNTPDQTKATREQYLAYLRSIVQQFDLPVATHEPVRRAKRDDAGGFIVQTTRRRVRCDRLVLAIGDMHRPRELGVDGEDLPHVSHYFDEPHGYFGRNLLIVGGRNSAAEAALRCHRAGANVALSYRGDSFDDNGIKYWLLPELKALINAGEIKFHPNTVPTAITDTHVTLKKELKKVSDTVDAVPADHVLLLTGYTQDKTLFEMLGVELVGENRAPAVDADTMQTDVPGLYVAGTAAAGTQQRFKLFIENCHVHAAKIAQAITGESPPLEFINQAAKTFGLEES
ncbi:MAG: NAD(P)-binding domain-containing protein [Phycisphaeraceae bacterium]